MFVIGVAGQAQMGKDTLADRLQLQLNGLVELQCKTHGEQFTPDKGWQRTAFAKNVKRVYAETFGVDYDFIEEWKVKPEPPPGFGMTVRQSLQFIGDGFRQIKGSIWVDLCFRDPSLAQIISDVRYPNEFLRVKQEGGLNIVIGRTDKLNDDPNGSEALIRPYVEWFLNNTSGNVVKVSDLNLEGSPEHSDKFDLFVRNDGTVEDLYQSVDTEVLSFASDYVFDCTRQFTQHELLLALKLGAEETHRRDDAVKQLFNQESKEAQLAEE